jgi:ribosome-associated protein
MEEIIKELITLIEEKQGNDLTVIDIEELTPYASYIFIVTTTSNVHARSLSKYITDFFSQKNLTKYLNKRSLESDNPWILIDGGDIVVHLFLKETREFYNLEKLYFNGKVIYGI